MPTVRNLQVVISEEPVDLTLLAKALAEQYLKDHQPDGSLKKQTVWLAEKEEEHEPFLK